MGQMEKQEPVHDWVENQTEFEGVLVCTNNLLDWDESAVVRAFLTFEWNDASSTGNDASFAHMATGVIVRYDGGVLAIDFPHGNDGVALVAALPDLFSVLYQIGWRTADLYHDPETINQLLKEIGAAIPAAMNLDVRAAPAGRVVSEITEGVEMVARGRQLLAGEQNDIDRILKDEIISMYNSGSTPHIEQSVQPQASRSIVVIDDDDTDDDAEIIVMQRDVGLVPAEMVVTQLVNVTAQPGDEEFDEQPRMVNLFTGSSGGEQHIAASSLFEDEIGVEIAPSDVAIYLEHEHSPAVMIADVETPFLVVDQQDVAQEQQKQQPAFQVDLMDEGANVVDVVNDLSFGNVVDIPLSQIVKIGFGAFCFDSPTNQLSNEDVLAIADECGVGSENITHLYPGAINGVVRWDALGEITAEYPWFAEKFVEAMLIKSGDCSLLASIILALKYRKPDAQLRDVLMFANTRELDMPRTLSELLLAAGGLIVRSGTSTDLTKKMNEVLRRLGSLALAPVGESFVDLPIGWGATGDASVDVVNADAGINSGQRVLTVRAVAQSLHAEIFVVHVDCMDSPFVLWIVDLLRFVVANYAATKRYTCEVAGVPDTGENASAVAVASEGGDLAQAREMMAQLAVMFAKLEK